MSVLPLPIHPLGGAQMKARGNIKDFGSRHDLGAVCAEDSRKLSPRLEHGPPRFPEGLVK